MLLHPQPRPGGLGNGLQKRLRKAHILAALVGDLGKGSAEAVRALCNQMDMVKPPLDRQGCQYLVIVKGKRLAVLNAEDWEAMVEWLETIEDVQVAQQAFERLKAAGGDRKQAGWLEWRERPLDGVTEQCIIIVYSHNV